jgi:hypothetical protein
VTTLPPELEQASRRCCCGRDCNTLADLIRRVNEFIEKRAQEIVAERIKEGTIEKVTDA